MLYYLRVLKHKGVMAPRLSWSVLFGLLLLSCLAAPGQSGKLRDEETSTGKLANPFQSGDESHRLLQSYIVSILNAEESQSRPEINSREQEVFFLFRLHDYDQSGFLDGLEMIRLLSDYNAFYRPDVYHYNEVVSLVDFLLQTQDRNHDGLFTPSELLSPPLLQEQQEESVKDHNEQSETMAPPVHQGQPEM
ncbi:cell growth regulator with EF hand domain protein 1 [Eucyclogobius newberryi]|uniref:cell growth regulator with EF hand domain protein 1 n=1 Tax=Eucyclogobius newberryi TaxID=166745 RepID=UPI003B592B52